MIKVKIKRFDTSLPLPEYKTSGAVAVDMIAREDTTIAPHEIGYIPLNVAIQIPKNCWVLLAARSSTHKLGIMPANGIGIGDEDFCGDEDEYRFAALNFTNKKVTIEKGTRVSQMMILKREKIEFVEIKKMKNKSRGGFGTTGKK